MLYSIPPYKWCKRCYGFDGYIYKKSRVDFLVSHRASTRVRIGECSRDTVGSGEIKFQGWTKTSNCCLLVWYWFIKGWRKKALRINHVVLQVEGYAMAHFLTHIKKWNAKKPKKNKSNTFIVTTAIQKCSVNLTKNRSVLSERSW